MDAIDAALKIYDDTGDATELATAIAKHNITEKLNTDLAKAVAEFREHPLDPELRKTFFEAYKWVRENRPVKPLEKETFGDTPLKRDWLIANWLPAGRLASLYGPGGAGKSRLALQVAAAVMTGGTPITVDANAATQADAKALGQPLEGERKVLWLSWEDEQNEFHRRWEMAYNAGAIGSEKVPDNLSYIDMRKIGSALWGPTPGSHVSTTGDWTDAGKRFLQTLKGHRLAVIDPIAAAFASNENDRSLVRAFATAIDQAGEETGCAVLLIGHPPKGEGGVQNSAGYSGSTDWRNAVRSMWILECVDETGYVDEQDNNSKMRAWRLRLDKASYGREGATVWLSKHYDDSKNDKKELAWKITNARQAAQTHNPDHTIKPFEKKKTGGKTASKKQTESTKPDLEKDDNQFNWKKY